MYMFSFESNNYFQFIVCVIGLWVILDACACSEEDVAKIKQSKNASDRLLLDLFGRGCLALKKHKILKAIFVVALAVIMAMVV